MTAAQVRRWLVLAALVLGGGAALARTPVKPARHDAHSSKPALRPVNGC